MNSPVRQKKQRKKQRSRVLKVLVTGPRKSGKTAFIQSISQYTEYNDQTGWFFGRVRVDHDLILHLLEPPADQQTEFFWMQDMVSRIRATGFVVMVNSAYSNTFAEFVSILYTIRGFHHNLPLVVAANHQDHPRAWNVEDIALGLGITDMNMYPCVATNRDAVRDILVELLTMAMPAPHSS